MHAIKGKWALVTGGTSGIGRAIAVAFAKEGGSICIIGTDPGRAEKAIAAMQATAPLAEQQFLFFQSDVGSHSQLLETLKEISTLVSSFHSVINCAGITRDRLLMRMKEKEWDDVMNINLKSTFTVCQYMIRSMIKKEEGSIINISSVIGIKGNPGQVNYSASKAGMIGFTRSLAKEVAGKNIRVNCIAPGFIETRMTDQLSDQQKSLIIQEIPNKRLGKPDDVANLALFLSSEGAHYITGQTIAVDGGMTA
ncbi:MAG: 3-oxoacyl-[acyl-carrier-protein] reductase [Chlamydiota bacterium]|nr:3-oxoacyl-[acyl-carrier-protein] reductase [Chlamydiota bacterium]